MRIGSWHEIYEILIKYFRKNLLKKFRIVQHSLKSVCNSLIFYLLPSYKIPLTQFNIFIIASLRLTKHYAMKTYGNING
jgi:hypothetical protein